MCNNTAFQVSQRDVESEKRLKKDLKRTKVLLADAQIMLDHLKSNAPSKREIAQLKNQVCRSIEHCVSADGGLKLGYNKKTCFSNFSLRLQKYTRRLILCITGIDPLSRPTNVCPSSSPVTSPASCFSQLEESEFTCSAAVKARKSMEIEIEDLHIQMEDVAKTKMSVSWFLEGAV